MHINACGLVNMRMYVCSVRGACGVMYAGALCALGRSRGGLWIAALSGVEERPEGPGVKEAGLVSEEHERGGFS